MAISILSRSSQNFGSQSGAVGEIQLDSSYPTGGYTLPASSFALSAINSFLITTDDANLLFYNYTTGKLMAFTAAGGAGGNTGNATATNSPSAVTGTGTGTADAQAWTPGAYTPSGTNGSSSVSAQTFTGSASTLNVLSPSFSGTGTTAVGQVITTTDNQTMALNECAGRWLIQATATTPPNLILSNTAVAGAPAVLTVQGVANTDAGAYSIVSTIPVGTNSTSTADAQIFTGNAAALSGTNAPSAVTVAALTATADAQVQAAHNHTVAAGGGGLTEVANGTNLSTVIGNYIVMGS